MKARNKGSLPNSEIGRIQAYLEGTMNPEEAHRFELEMMEDPFLSDAVEGFADNPDWKGLDALKSQIQVQGPSYNAWYLFGGVLILVIVAGGMWAWFGNRPVMLENEEAQSTLSNVQTPEEPIEQDADQQILEVNSTDSSISITIDRSDLPEPLPAERFMSLREADPIEPMEKLSTPTQELKTLGKESKDIKKPGSRIYHVRNYKLADYRGQRFPIEQENISIISGTPANNGLIDQHGMIPSSSSIPYIDFVEGAITHFARKEYDQAFDRFKTILSTYPDDVNAQFYGGMSAYYLGVYAVAENLLRKSEVNTIDTFRDEAAFYRAVCLFEMNRREEAEVIFKAIVQKKGFYSEQAAAWLK